MLSYLEVGYKELKVYFPDYAMFNYEECHYYASNVLIGKNTVIRFYDENEAKEMLKLFKKYKLIVDIDNVVEKQEYFNEYLVMLRLESEYKQGRYLGK